MQSSLQQHNKSVDDHQAAPARSTKSANLIDLSTRLTVVKSLQQLLPSSSANVHIMQKVLTTHVLASPPAMDCGLLSACSSSPHASPRKSRSVKKQWSSKRHSQEEVLQEPCREWPVDPCEYELLDLAGKGACAVVYRGRCRVLDEVVAIKRLDLDANWDLSALIREATLMKRLNHPNVLPLHAAFVAGRELWLVTPFMGLGSVRSIMKQHYPQGLDEVVIATIMQPVLLALEHVHKNGGIHRDLKADNILVSEEGDVALADFGVAAARMREVSMVNMMAQDMQALLATTFVGTPCWMAPEVMAQTEQGYHTSADIWSFGITLIELAHGRPPLARMNPMRVLMDTLHKPPPSLGDHPSQGTHFSKAFKDCVDECLQKDPEQRPTAAALLNHRFFRMSRTADFLKEHFCSAVTPGMPAASPHAPSGSSPRQLLPLPAGAQQQPRSRQERALGAAGVFGPLSAANPQAGLLSSSSSAVPHPLAATGPSQGLGSPRHQKQHKKQGVGAIAARAAGSFLSGPSTSGPSRRISGWLFPQQPLPAQQPQPPAAATAAATGGVGAAAETGTTQQQPPPGEGGAGSSAGSVKRGQQQQRPQLQLRAASVAASAASAALRGSQQRAGSCSSAGSLEQQLQPFLLEQQQHQQALLRAGSSGCVPAACAFGSVSAGVAAAPSSRANSSSSSSSSASGTLGAARLFAAASMQHGLVLEAHAEVEGDEDDAVLPPTPATAAGAGPGLPAAATGASADSDALVRVVVVDTAAAGAKHQASAFAGAAAARGGGDGRHVAATTSHWQQQQQAEEAGSCVMSVAQQHSGKGHELTPPSSSGSLLRSGSSLKQAVSHALSDMFDWVLPGSPTKAGGGNKAAGPAGPAGATRVSEQCP